MFTFFPLALDCKFHLSFTPKQGFVYCAAALTLSVLKAGEGYWGKEVEVREWSLSSTWLQGPLEAALAFVGSIPPFSPLFLVTELKPHSSLELSEIGPKGDPGCWQRCLTCYHRCMNIFFLLLTLALLACCIREELWVYNKQVLIC